MQKALAGDAVLTAAMLDLILHHTSVVSPARTIASRTSAAPASSPRRIRHRNKPRRKRTALFIARAGQ